MRKSNEKIIPRRTRLEIAATLISSPLFPYCHLNFKVLFIMLRTLVHFVRIFCWRHCRIGTFYWHVQYIQYIQLPYSVGIFNEYYSSGSVGLLSWHIQLVSSNGMFS